MALRDIRHAESVVAAVREFDDLGREAFLRKYGFAPSRRYYLEYAGRRYDAKAIIGVAHGYERPDDGPLGPAQFSGGEEAANRVLRELRFSVVTDQEDPISAEREWRLGTWATLLRLGISDIRPATLRELGVYGGAQGVWVDAERTRSLMPTGLTVGLLHTGTSYPDDLSEEGIFYHYPKTGRAGGERDRAEIAATKAAGTLQLPVFVITKPTPRSPVRDVQLGWVEGWDDESKIFLVTFADQPPSRILDCDHSDDEPFVLVDERPKTKRLVAARRGQQEFRLRVLQRYGPRCVVTGISVPTMLDAVHLRAVSEGGSNDPRNGLVLSAAHHRAFDAGLFAFEPDTLSVVTRPGGPTRGDLGIRNDDLAHLKSTPHPEAVAWHYQQWRRGLV